MEQNRFTAAVPPYYGIVLKKGSRGPDVALIQSWMDALSVSTRMGKIDGVFGSGTESAVKIFQMKAELETDGKVGSATWEALYFAFAEQQGQKEIYPGVAVRQGAVGAVVKSMQEHLTEISSVYTAISKISADGKFGPATGSSLRCFQRMFGLSVDGVMGQKSFAMLRLAWEGVKSGHPVKVAAPYGGRVLTVGSQGDSVKMVQSFLNRVQPGAQALAVDGKFGKATEQAVMQFQLHSEIKTDGKVGRITWEKLVNAFNSTL